MSHELAEPVADESTFVEVALRLGGKSEEESRKTGRLDRADEQVEEMFATRYQTAHSPIHRAIWERDLPVDLFQPTEPTVPDSCRRVMDDSIAVVRRHVAAGSLHDDNGKIARVVLDDLGAAGYWGLLVDREYGGQGTPFSAFAAFLTRMATVDATVAGLASVHGCIGAVDPLRTFGTPEQKARLLPGLASGARLSGFALTEPGAGSDLTALRTTARLDGDDYVVDGEKLFITNAVPGRTVGLVCLIDGKPAVLIADLPDREDEHFQIIKYGLYALKHSYNNGLRFRGFRVPRANLLKPTRGDGLTIAYHGLNLGRVALCANAAGTMRTMLANLLPWADFRRTYGAKIATRELVLRRIGRLAGLIVGGRCARRLVLLAARSGLSRRDGMCDCENFWQSEMQKEAAIELFMKTHGGRAFLHGHIFGDNVHEYLAPCIYEGEGEMLGMAFFKSLVKEHGKTFFEPIGRVLQASGIRVPNPLNPAHAWALKDAAIPYFRWRAAQMVVGRRRTRWPEMPDALRKHAAFADQGLADGRVEISKVMAKHQLKLADRQCRMAELSQRLQDLVVILATSTWAARQADPIVRDAADILCRDLTRKLTGRRPTDADFRAVTKLGAAITSGGFGDIRGIDAEPILMSYDDSSR